MSKLFNDSDVSETVKLVVKNSYRIQNCNGKDLIIVIAREESGKSTFINAMRGMKFKYCEDGRTLEPVEKMEGYAPMGSHEKGGVMCTEFPECYILDPTDGAICFLDTQGHFGIEKNSNLVASSSVLLDAAIQIAKSVRIIFLENFENFWRGLTRITDSLQLLNRVVSNFNCPIFFLYNQYQPPPQASKDFYQMNDCQQNEKILEEIKKQAEKVVSAAKSNSEELKNRFKNKQVNEEDINIVKDCCDKEIFANLIEINFKEGRFGYIDPMSEWSINNLKSNLTNIPIADKNFLSFNLCNEDRIKFQHDFEETLLKKISPLVNDIYFSLRYPPNLIDKIIKKDEMEINSKKDLIRMISKDQYVHIPEINEIYYKKRKYLMKNCVNLKNQLKNIEEEIQKIINHDPVKHLDIFFDDPIPFYYCWRNHTVKYEDSIPYVSIVEVLNNGTLKDKIVNFDIRKFNETKYNDSITIFELRDKTQPISNYEVTYCSHSFIEKVASISIFSFEFLSNFYYQIDLSFIKGFLIGCLPERRNCRGYLSFYVRYQDKEKDSLEKLQNDKSKVESSIKNNEAEMIENEKNIKSNKIQILIKYICNLKNDIEKMIEIKKFEEEILKQWNETNDNNESFKNLEEELNGYYQVCKMLYPKSNSNLAVKNFQMFYEMLINVKPEDPELTDINIIQLFTLRNLNFYFSIK